jgi:uncharacterized membrane protein YecN with MAPEG domain
MNLEVGLAMKAAALWSGLLLFLLLGLSGLVVRQRRRHRVAIGDDGVPELVQALRAFGNATEYATPAIAALAVLALVGAQPWLVHIVGCLMLLGRIAHAVGLSLTAGPSIGRTVGMLLTWVSLLIAAVSLVISGL